MAEHLKSRKTRLSNYSIGRFDDLRSTTDPRLRLIHEAGLAIRAQQNAVDQMDEAAAAFLGINRTDARALDILDQRGPMTAGELAQAMGLSTGAVTTVLDRMERTGFARRVRDQDDRRKVVAEVTEEGRHRSWEIYAPLAERGFEELSRLTDRQLVTIRDLLNRGTEFLIEYAERVREMTRRRDEAQGSKGTGARTS